MANDMLNPYIAGAPVVETSMFFGREDVFGWIERSLEGKFVNHILVLHGQRRVGKTSVLKQIPNFLPDKYIQVFFDLQGRTGVKLDRFLWWLASEIVRTLKREYNIDIPKPDRKAFEDTEHLISEFLPGLRPLLGDYVLLFTFDEFDSLDRPEIQETLSRPLIAYLRRLIEVKGLNFIFSIGSSGDKLENMQASYTDFFKSALYRKISFLTDEDIQRLVTKPVEGLIKYEKKAVRRIGEITSGHPYFTQLMCHELFSRCQKTGERTISADDVEAVLEDVVERGTVNLKFVWDEASDLEKWILATLAQMDGGNNQKLAEALTAQRVRFSDSDLNSAVIHLRDKDVITEDNRFINYLMRLWLVANRPTDRVREELVEVNPIANRYIEIGDEYRDLGQTQQAIESYQQALNVDSGNLKAQANIASVYLDQGMYEQAATAFELALKIDDEDVVAKTGYCDANLALGDAARGRGENDRAIALYQKILVINAAHTDARQRLADIYREQADRQLDEGREDEALRSLNRAMEFTPENGSLSARYDEILAQKKDMLVAQWLGKAEKALSRQRWDEAAGMVEEAIKVDPKNEELAGRLTEVKDAPRQLKLQSYRREAEGAITRGNWEKAIAALETASLLAPEDEGLRNLLDSVRGGQRDAQLNLHLRDAENAIKAGDWQAALASRQAALKLNPNNPDLQRALEQTRQAQHQAQLVLFHTRVDAAVTAGDWEAATQAIKEAIRFAPQDETWKDKLSEVETTRHQAHLEGFRSQADAAREAGNWEAAIAALEAYQKLEPGDEKIQAEIETLRAQKRESALTAFKEQAERAARAEKWDEAVRTWEAYLKLEPDDAGVVADKLQHARKYAKLSGNYAAAQEAIRKKRYGKAIELLQGILAQEPTYKSTSRLLVEAVEANKAIPIWRRAWIYWAVGAVAVLILGIFFGPNLWQSMKGQPVAFETPIETPTKIPEEPPPAAEPIAINPNRYVYINKEKTWHEAKDYCAALGGYLVTIQNADENEFVNQLAGEGRPWLGATDETEEGTWVWVTGEPWEYTNWVSNQPDNYSGEDPNGEDFLTLGTLGSNSSRWNDASELYSQPFVCEWDTEPHFYTTYNSLQNLEPDYQTSFDTWDFVELPEEATFASIDTGKLVVTSEGEHVGVGLDIFDTDHLAIEFEFSILDSGQDGHCIFYTEGYGFGDHEIYRSATSGFHNSGGTNFALIIPPDTQEDFAYGSFDASKINKYTLIILGDQIAGFINGQMVYAVRDPNGKAIYTVNSFAASHGITCEYDNFKAWDLDLTSPEQKAWEWIQIQEPTYQTSFDTWDFGKPVENASVEDGKLILAAENGSGTHVDINKSSSDNFAVEFEFRNLQSDTNSSCNFKTGNDQEAWSESWKALSAQFNENSALLGRFVYPGVEDFVWGSHNGSSVNTVTLIILGDYIAGFINGELIYYVPNPDENAIYSHHMLGVHGANERYVCEFDNYKFWDLSGVEFLTSATQQPAWVTNFAEPILASIAGREPEYQDDFGIGSSGWNVDYCPGSLKHVGEELVFTDCRIYRTNIDWRDFTVEFDIRFVEGTSTSSYFAFHFRETDYQSHSIHLYQDGHVTIDFANSNRVELSGAYPAYQTNHLLLIAKGNRFAFYLNGKPFYYKEYDSQRFGRSVYYAENPGTDSQAILAMDNFKIWDISAVSIP